MAELNDAPATTMAPGPAGGAAGAGAAGVARRQVAAGNDVAARGAIDADLDAGAGAGGRLEAELRSRIGALEALVEARTATIVALATQLAEHQGSTPAFSSTRLADAERQLAELRATKLFRYAAVPRRWYAKARARG